MKWTPFVIAGCIFLSVGIFIHFSSAKDMVECVRGQCKRCGKWYTFRGNAMRKAAERYHDEYVCASKGEHF